MSNENLVDDRPSSALAGRVVALLGAGLKPPLRSETASIRQSPATAFALLKHLSIEG